MNVTKLNHAAKCKISHKLSNEYSPVSSELYLKPFVDKGWIKTKGVFNNKGTKEWITLEHPDYKLGEDSIRIELRNSYDGSSALMIMGGLGRIVCSNGLVVGKDFESFRFIHRGDNVYERLEKSYDLIVAKLDELKNKMDKLKSIQLNTQQVNDVIHNIYKEVVEKDTKNKKVTLLNINTWVLQQTQRPRRKADESTDAFTTMNVVQEQIIRCGIFNCNVVETDKQLNQQQVKEVVKNRSEGKLSSMKLNEIITEKFLDLVSA
jgi:hypothetical protein